MKRSTTAGAEPVAGSASHTKTAGVALRQLFLDQIRALTAEVGMCRLRRRFVAADLLRGRTSSVERIGETLADAAAAGADPLHVRQIAEAFAAWCRGLVSHCRVCVIDAWDRESRLQLDADLLQRRAVVSHDPHVVARAIESTDAHIAAAQQLRDTLAQRHATLTLTHRCA